MVHRSDAEPTPPGVDWGSLIWPGGRPTGDTQVLADREAAAAAIAARAAHPDGTDRPDGRPEAGRRGRADHVWRDRPLLSRVPAQDRTGADLDVEPALTPASGGVATLTEDAPRTAPELEPWNPEATYDSLVRLLGELKALHPDEVAVLPTRPSRLAVRRPGRLLAAVAAAAVLVAGVGTLLVTHRSPHRAAAAVAAARMSTVLVAIDTGDSLAGANLLASDGSKAQEILLPSRLLVDLPGQGSTQLAAAPRSGVDAAAMAVENALHVRVDGTWILDPATLGALVSAEGGVDVTLTNDVLPGDGSAALAIGVGTSHITGPQAEQLAVAIGAQEPEASRLARQQILLEAILAKLPRTPGPDRAAALPGPDRRLVDPGHPGHPARPRATGRRRRAGRLDRGAEHRDRQRVGHPVVRARRQRHRDHGLGAAGRCDAAGAGRRSGPDPRAERRRHGRPGR